MVQIISAIKYRRWEEEKKNQAYMEWQTRTLATFVVSTIQDNKAREHMMEEATKISMQRTAQEVEAGQPLSEKSFAEIVENGNVEAALEANSRRKSPMPFRM